MIHSLQRLLARIAAVAAILLGAALALVLAIFTLFAGLVIGLFATIAAWFATRSRGGQPRSGPGPFGRPDSRPPAQTQGRPDGRRDDTVIDVEMREIDGPKEQPKTGENSDDPASRR